jgi:MFS family permease
MPFSQLGELMSATETTARRVVPSLLRRDRDFARFWLGESVSAIGSQFTLLAIPLVAVQLLEATPNQMGVLGALGTVPYLLFAVAAGVWTDRSRKRPLLIGAQVAAAVLLLLIPALALFGMLRLGHLYAIVFGVGAAKVLFEVAYQSYLPQLVQRDDLVQANSRLTASTSVAEIGGPGLGGLLVSVLTAPIAVVVDAVSFLVAALALTRIRRPEPVPVLQPGRRLYAEISEGFRETFRNRYLLAFAGEAATYNAAWSAINALLVLWAVRELGLSPATLGLLLSVGSVGALIGALLTDRVARRIGVGRAMWTSAVVSNLGVLLIPAAAGRPTVVLVVLGTAFFLQGLGMTGTNVHTYAIRQAVTPAAMLGRSSAAYRVLTYGFIPLGALLGGVLGEAIGLRPALLVGALLLFPSWCWLFFSPARSLRTLPAGPGEPG